MGPLPFAPSTLAVLVGVSGAGKSHFAAQYPASWRVCLDTFREMATDDMADQTATPVAAQIQTLLLDARLARGLTFSELGLERMKLAQALPVVRSRDLGVLLEDQPLASGWHR